MSSAMYAEDSPVNFTALSKIYSLYKCWFHYCTINFRKEVVMKCTQRWTLLVDGTPDYWAALSNQLKLLQHFIL